ncbi:MAG: TonB-dependent receptor [Gammaproteobacteria bacterium]|nr:TonB-dependent receptor [Gammaproteobacteria bacterium]
MEINAGIEYEWGTDIGSFRAKGEVYYSDDYDFQIFDNKQDRQESFTILNFHLGYTSPSERYSVLGYLRNATEEERLNTLFFAPPVGIVGEHGEPRTWGVEFNQRAAIATSGSWDRFVSSMHSFSALRTKALRGCLRVAVTIVGMLFTGSATGDRASPLERHRTSWGVPDLQGIWDFRTRTPFERPVEFGDKAVITPAEAREFLQRPHEVLGDDRPDDPELDLIGAYNEFWLDPGSELDGGRTSLIVDPPNGRLPDMTAAARELIRQLVEERSPPVREIATNVSSDYRFAHPETLGLSNRCLVGFNAGPPITPGAYNNNLRIVQTPGYVVIHTEMIHETRIVPTDGRSHLPAEMRLWLGDSVGHWEGDTLAVDTTNFTAKKPAFEVPGYTPPIGTAEDLHLVERFTRIDAGLLEYEYRLSSPASFTRPFTARIMMKASTDKLYEYACHEGNYAMGAILRGARAQEQRDRAASD